MRKIILIAISIIVSISLNSCASILNGKQQKVIVHTKKPKSQVYVNDKKVGKGRSPQVKLTRDTKIKQIRVETEGYKDRYAVHYQSRKSPLYIMSWVPFGILLYPPFLDTRPKSYDYKKEVFVSERLIPVNEKADDEKYLFVKNVAFDLDEKDLKIKRISHRRLKKNKLKKAREIASNDEEFKFDNSIFTDALNEVLVDYKYTDTLNTIFKNKANTSYVSAKVSKVDVQVVYHSYAYKYFEFLVTNVNIEWQLLDVYGQEIATKRLKGKSGEFSTEFYEPKEGLLLSVKDAIEASFLQFINDKQVRPSLKKGQSEIEKLDDIVLNKGRIVANTGEAMKATVTIKTDDGHGSGFMISTDGYLVTNFHVVAGQEDLTIITKSGEEFKGTLIRQNESLDLALVKIDTSSKIHFDLPAAANYTVGEDIFVIGTPTSIELGQTLSKGIISGDREKNDVKLIQTDASINGGNSGGPLTSKNGNLYGVVNAKMSGVGIEGLGFAVPAEKIRSGLFLK